MYFAQYLFDYGKDNEANSIMERLLLLENREYFAKLNGADFRRTYYSRNICIYCGVGKFTSVLEMKLHIGEH